MDLVVWRRRCPTLKNRNKCLLQSIQRG